MLGSDKRPYLPPASSGSSHRQPEGPLTREAQASSPGRGHPAVQKPTPRSSGTAGGAVTHRRRCPATEAWAVSRPWYRASEAHCAMARCMRYCTVSMRSTPAPRSSTRRSIRLRASPASAALWPGRSQEGGLSPGAGARQCPTPQAPRPPLWLQTGHLRPGTPRDQGDLADGVKLRGRAGG